MRLALDASGFIRSVEIVDQPPSAGASPTNRDQTISRLAVLKAAAAFLGQMGQVREEVRSDHVLVLAEKGSPGSSRIPARPGRPVRMQVPQTPRRTPPDHPVVGQLLQSGIEALCTLVAAMLLATDDRLSADQAAERVAQLRHEVHHALQDWAPPPDSYRARNLASHE